MGFIANMLFQHKEKVKHRNDVCDMLLVEIDNALKESQSWFSDICNFIEPRKATEWCSRYAALMQNVNDTNIYKLKRALHYKMLAEAQKALYQNASMLQRQIGQHNEQVAQLRIQQAYELIGNVEGKPLDRQQMSCIVKEAYNHLVIAGAGTGKTTTVVGKIKYLLKSGKCKPEDILVLSFTHASADEMSERINKETGCKIEAMTFHKLGMNIITKAEGIAPKITKLDLRKYIKEQLSLHMKSEVYLRLLCTYLFYNRVVTKHEFEFKTQAEYEEYKRLNPPITMNNETVKSYGEMEIANFLLENGISYIYENPYEIDTRTREFSQYYPDFYLPDYHIYIEYFAVNKNGDVPDYFKSSQGKSATQVYQESMLWKRELHKQNNTVMIECYAYEQFEGKLLENLKQHLIEKAVVFRPKTSQELWLQVSAEDNSVLDGIIELFQTVINLIKSNGYTIEDVKRLNVGSINLQSNGIILSLLEPIFNGYCSYLKENNEIDFNDMINTAAQYIRQRQFISPYKYVIVDEYQDISKARYSLLKSMRESNDFELFCVGDDWQSIYRFAGSDIGFTLNFENYWGPTDISKIETTYRFTQSLIEVSGYFVMKNPMQICKRIRGQSTDNSFALGEISGYTDKYVVEFMAQKIEDLPRESSVFFIGRYSFDVDLLEQSSIFYCYYNNISGFVEVKYRKRPDLKMNFITAHKSKGLQADYVFILNNKNARMGFPSKMQDAAILNLLLENHEQYPYAEERRLFYVALTRAKKKAILLTIEGKESEFVIELKNRYGREMQMERFTCPQCGGRLIKRNGPYGEFFGCSNYRVTGCTYKRNIKSKYPVEYNRK